MSETGDGEVISRLREDTERNEMAGENTTLRQKVSPYGAWVWLEIFAVASVACVSVALCEVGICQDLRPELREQTAGEIVDANGLEGKVLCGYQG